MEVEETTTDSEPNVPFLAQLISGTYEEQKRKQSLAHEKGEGAPCTKCGPECSGFELHFWRKVCKNCSCKPQDHEINVKRRVHSLIISNLFQAKDGTSTLNEPEEDDEDNGTNIDNAEVFREPSSSNENRQMAVEVPKIEVSEIEEPKQIPAPPPRKESYREMQKYRERLNQLPPQDFDPKYCNTLNRRERQAMNKLADIKRQAAGRGILVEYDGKGGLSCEGCKSPLKIGEKAVFAVINQTQKQWHPSCFKCFSCNQPIADFVYFAYEDNIYCGRHFGEKYRPRCGACDELIYADKFTEAEGKKWHRQHFVCFMCDKDLAETQYVSHKSQPHCILCYHMKVANKCRSCLLPIEVGEERITHETMHWHASSQCFFCHGCSRNLVDEAFLLNDYKTYCSSNFEILYGSGILSHFSSWGGAPHDEATIIITNHCLHGDYIHNHVTLGVASFESPMTKTFSDSVLGGWLKHQNFMTTRPETSTIFQLPQRQLADISSSSRREEPTKTSAKAKKEGKGGQCFVDAMSEKENDSQRALAHEKGSGAPCQKCGPKCEGLDLHFWRKTCKNCKCKEEDHQVSVQKLDIQRSILESIFPSPTEDKVAVVILSNDESTKKDRPESNFTKTKVSEKEATKDVAPLGHEKQLPKTAEADVIDDDDFPAPPPPPPKLYVPAPENLGVREASTGENGVEYSLSQALLDLESYAAF
eukprot:gene6934-7713_t